MAPFKSNDFTKHPTQSTLRAPLVTTRERRGTHEQPSCSAMPVHGRNPSTEGNPPAQEPRLVAPAAGPAGAASEFPAVRSHGGEVRLRQGVQEPGPERGDQGPG